MEYIESKDEKIAIIQYVLNKYIIPDTSIDGNRRRFAVILMLELKSKEWNNIFESHDNSITFILNALRILNEKEPNNKYDNMINEIYTFFDNDDDN
jgi:hypothetical protein